MQGVLLTIQGGGHHSGEKRKFMKVIDEGLKKGGSYPTFFEDQRSSLYLKGGVELQPR